MAGAVEIDDKTGVETTGHEWDGVKELNNPLPNWWRWVFYACIVWSIGYWIAYPAWPLLSSHTKGVLGYSSRADVAVELANAEAAKGGMLSRIQAASLEDIRTNPDLLEFALAGGRSAFAVNCSQCHGSGAQGFKGYPNLNDDEWLWGGSLNAIAATITHGVRNETDEDARSSDMPRFGADELLSRAQVNDVVSHILTISGQASGSDASARGAAIFAEQCVACHTASGGGNAELGAPPLNNGIWLYGGDRQSLFDTVWGSRRGVMPAWGQILDAATIKQLAIHVHSLGGGQ